MKTTVKSPGRTRAGASRASPWYREPLVWLVLAIPATAVLAGAVMLVLANATWDGLVADDYYRRGLQINRSLARDSQAAHLGLEAVAAFPAPGVVEVRISGAEAPASGDRLTLRFARAARAGTDVRILLTPYAGGIWRGVRPEMAPGKWYVELGNEQWRLVGPMRMPPVSGKFALRATVAHTQDRRAPHR